MKKHKLLAAYMAILLAFTTYVTLDTFVITRVYGNAAQQETQQTQQNSQQTAAPDQNTQNDDQTGSTDNAGDQQKSDSDSQTKHKHGKGKRPGPGGHGGNNGFGSHSKISSGSVTEDPSQTESDTSNDSTSASSSGSTTDTYSDSNIQVTLKQYRQNNTTIYVADVTVSSPEYLKTALAQGAYGKNVTQKTSEIAASVDAVLAINGDFYGAQEKGYVIRNGVLYRNTAVSGAEDLVIYSDGSFEIISEDEITAEQLLAKGAVQTLSFGPALIENGSVTVSQNEEVGKSMASNPRTAIGIIDECHYVFVVSDGRTDASEGLSLYQLAQFMDTLGVETAYNLDGGGSSTMYFNGSVVNNPTTGGSIKERSVSDIVYIGK